VALLRCISAIEAVKKAKGNEGYNVATGEYEDLVKAGLVDPKKVTRMALKNAANIAGLLLTTECLITDISEKENRLRCRAAAAVAWAEWITKPVKVKRDLRNTRGPEKSRPRFCSLAFPNPSEIQYGGGGGS